MLATKAHKYIYFFNLKYFIYKKHINLATNTTNFTYKT